jgi:hypothetical protein
MQPLPSKSKSGFGYQDYYHSGEGQRTYGGENTNKMSFTPRTPRASERFSDLKQKYSGSGFFNTHTDFNKGSSQQHNFKMPRDQELDIDDAHVVTDTLLPNEIRISSAASFSG